MITPAEIDHVLIFFSLFLCVSLMIYRTLSANLAIGAFLCACVFIWVDGHIKSAALPVAFKRQVEGAYIFELAKKPAGEVGYGSGVFNVLSQDGVPVLPFHAKGEIFAS